MSGRNARPRGFTLLELIIVLAIISAMISIVLPYAGRSSDNLRLKQECLNIVELARYAMSLSGETRRTTRIVISPQQKIYSLEIASANDRYNFKPVENVQGAIGRLRADVQIMDVDGFDVQAKNYCLVFDPEKDWPKASITLANNDTITTITIIAGSLEITEPTY